MKIKELAVFATPYAFNQIAAKTGFSPLKWQKSGDLIQYR
jgi:hypothetical protein